MRFLQVVPIEAPYFFVEFDNEERLLHRLSLKMPLRCDLYWVNLHCVIFIVNKRTNTLYNLRNAQRAIVNNMTICYRK